MAPPVGDTPPRRPCFTGRAHALRGPQCAGIAGPSPALRRSYPRPDPWGCVFYEGTTSTMPNVKDLRQLCCPQYPLVHHASALALSDTNLW